EAITAASCRVSSGWEVSRTARSPTWYAVPSRSYLASAPISLASTGCDPSDRYSRSSITGWTGSADTPTSTVRDGTPRPVSTSAQRSRAGTPASFHEYGRAVTVTPRLRPSAVRSTAVQVLPGGIPAVPFSPGGWNGAIAVASGGPVDGAGEGSRLEASRAGVDDAARGAAGGRGRNLARAR